MYNVHTTIIFSIICICECVYIDRFLGSFLLNNNSTPKCYFAYCFVYCGGSLALQHEGMFLY